MEEKTQSQTSNKEEIVLLTFQPQQMLEEIENLKEEIKNLLLEKRTLQMLYLDLTLEIDRLKKKIPKSWREIYQDILLLMFGGQWEETKQ